MKLKLPNSKKPPKGYEKIENDIMQLQQKLHLAGIEINDSKKKNEYLWPILKIHHQISRLIYKSFKDNIISKDVLNYCISEKIADGKLIAKWKKPGYEKLCCLMCIQNKSHNFGTTCICRVPKNKLNENQTFECIHCGCGGCASCDV